MSARAIMFQGTGSDVGKSLIVAGLCRLFARKGLRVAPFKAQNMSNNAAVAADGGEIGRAQYLQAIAAGVAPSVHMNPVLLKPQSDHSSQVILRGKAVATMGAQEYQTYRPSLMPSVLESYYHLAKDADLVLVEGAGSPAEINLRGGDIANMGFARASNCPVVLIGDIDRGGVIASIVGTHAVLAQEDRAMIRGFLINKFRGDAKLFENGAKEIERFTSWPYIGLVPYNAALSQLPQEDSLALTKTEKGKSGNVNIVVLAYPHIANFDDLDPLKNESGITLHWCKAGDVIPADTSLVILPGSKSTIADLNFLRAQGWDIDLKAHHRRGGRILGICGGFQMLGTVLSDPYGIEGAPATVEGLGFLESKTAFTNNKTVTPWQGKYQGLEVTGYEIHCGVSESSEAPLFTSAAGPEGACSQDNLVWGTYVHGLFSSDHFRNHVLKNIGASSSYSYGERIQKILDSWADMLEEAIKSDQLLLLAQPIKRPI